MSDLAHWEERYEKGETPWDTGRPSSELQRMVAEDAVAPCRAVELGCGTGTNAVWLARQGFDVTAIDLSTRAVERARRRAEAAGVAVRFLTADVLHPPPELAGGVSAGSVSPLAPSLPTHPPLMLLVSRGATLEQKSKWPISSVKSTLYECAAHGMRVCTVEVLYIGWKLYGITVHDAADGSHFSVPNPL